jgi:lysophospholipase L1-like esterase
MKPCPSRYVLMQRVDSANNMIREFLSDKSNTAYVDVFHQMLNAKGRPDPELFLEDRLHMNRRGYLIWKKAMEPYLLK